jgi:ubiquinone/menaquinone biosynthesis C-methylase UbiE
MFEFCKADCATRPSANSGPSTVLEARKTTTQAAARFSLLAPVYELWARWAEAQPRRRVLELASVKDGETILEVATGTGVQLVALGQRNPSGRTVGAEFADGMLKRTRKRLRAAQLDRVELQQGDARRLPFEDATFDLVTNEYMLNLMPHADIGRAVAEFHRVLKPGGRLVITNMTRGGKRHHQVWDALYARGIDVFVNCRGVLAAPLLEAVGFQDITREYMAPMMFPTELVSARKRMSSRLS